MKFRHFIPLLGIVAMIQIAACGGSGSNPPPPSLTISPPGPTTLTRDDTLAFSANLDVTWSVAGGDSRGTIDANGLYTPPVTLPLDELQVTVLAESADGQNAEAFVDLRAADALERGTPLPVNTGDLPFNAFFDGFILAPQADRFDVKMNSIHIHSTWPGDDGGATKIFYSQSLDLMDFSPEEILFPASPPNRTPLSLELDSELNPMILFADDSTGTGRLRFTRSDNQGQSFKSPVSLQPDNPDNVQSGGNLAVDGQGVLHAVFEEEDESVLNGPTNIFYVRSENGGASWSEPKAVSAAIDDTELNRLPFLAVDPAGEKVAICWNRLSPLDIYFAHSEDGGETFSAEEPITTNGTSTFCRTAMGPNGDIYVSYSETVGMNGALVRLAKSTNGGVSFGAPVQVNSSALNLDELLSHLSVDNLGRVDVVYPADPGNTTNFTHILHARSLDAGANFTEQTPIHAGAADHFAVTNGLRHDEAGRLYVQYAVVVAAMPSFQIYLVVAQ